MENSACDGGGTGAVRAGMCTVHTYMSHYMQCGVLCLIPDLE